MNGRIRRLIAWIGVFLMLVLSAAGCGQRQAEESGVADNTEWRAPVENGNEIDKTNEAAAEQASVREKKSFGKAVEIDTEGDGKETTRLGPLAVLGTQLVDSEGDPVQLRGISTHSLVWYPDYVNQECFAQLKEEWGVDVIRLAMYTGENGGYCTGGDKEGLKELVRNGVEYATACGLYVIIDWHILSDGNPNTYIEESRAFFREMSLEYADYTNVLYEICNEPNGGTSWSDVKSYAEQIIGVIRENDEDGIILVGTPNWCQYVDRAAADPIENCENVMYTLHFYADTFRDALRSTMADAIDAGLPVFVSEYGICDASGNGANNREEADRWINLMDQYGVSYVAWNLSNKAETAAIFKSSCSKVSGFTAEDLSDSGRWLYEMLTGKSAENAGIGWTGTNAEAAGEQNIPTDQNGLSVSASVVNSWEQGGKSCFQYVLTISNTTDEDCVSWLVQLHFNGDIILDSGWNGNYQTDGSHLTITSMDYNGNIVVGGSVGDIGFIVRGDKELALTE